MSKNITFPDFFRFTPPLAALNGGAQGNYKNYAFLSRPKFLKLPTEQKPNNVNHMQIVQRRNYSIASIRNTIPWLFVPRVASSSYLRHFLLAGIGGTLLAALSPISLDLNKNKEMVKRRLEHFRMAIKTDIRGDGNCQFRSIADQVYNDQERYTDVRKAIVDWLSNNKDFYVDDENTTKLCDFLIDTPWTNYINKMSSDGTWGDQLTLTAAAEVYQSNIWVLSSVAALKPEDAVTLTYPKKLRQESLQDKAKTLYLLNWFEYHYESLKPA